MIRIGLLKEGKIPPDNRVALTPAQCKWLQKMYSDIEIFVQSSEHRCYSDKEFERAGVKVVGNLNDCDILLGIKEVPVDALLENKTYLFFSHTRKKQVYNQRLLQTILEKKNYPDRL
jgi:saccharopine dehydrogenase (NAD+, L-lysine-forming)